MAEVKIRDLSEEYIAKIDALAAAAGISRESWLRQLIINATKQPIVRERYGIKFDSENGKNCGGVILRVPTPPSGRESNATIVINNVNVNGEAWQAAYKAKSLIETNGVGDLAEAIRLLKSHFDYVYEVPV